MPKKPMKQFFAWSYSRLHTFETCPAKARYQHLDKLPIVESEPLIRGKATHKDAELYSIGKKRKLPASLELFDEEFKELRKLKKHLAVEQQLAVDKHWQPCDWFGRQAWCRVVVDCAYVLDGTTLVIIDHKTGKIRPEHTDQLDLYAIVGFAHWGQVETVEAHLWYLDQGEITSKNYTRTEAEKLKKPWEKRVKPMLTAKSFKPTPSRLCSWCDFSQAKGGPCQY